MASLGALHRRQRGKIRTLRSSLSTAPPSPTARLPQKTEQLIAGDVAITDMAISDVGPVHQARRARLPQALRRLPDAGAPTRSPRSCPPPVVAGHRRVRTIRHPRRPTAPLPRRRSSIASTALEQPVDRGERDRPAALPVSSTTPSRPAPPPRPAPDESAREPPEHLHRVSDQAQVRPTHQRRSARASTRGTGTPSRATHPLRDTCIDDRRPAF